MRQQAQQRTALRTATANVEAHDRARVISVVFTINEGPQWLVSKLDLTGYEQLDASTLLPSLSSSVGQPFSEFNVAADRDTILAFYFTNGFPNATFEWSSQPGAQPDQYELHFSLHEGTRQFIRGVLLEGLNATRRSG